MQLIDGAPVYAATDLVGFLACRHRFALERAALGGLVDRPERVDPEIDLIRKRGFEHEARYLADLEASGRTVVRIEPDGYEADRGVVLRAAAAATIEQMRAGADVIYQATFFDGRWLGFADFLLRVDAPSALGGWSYEVADTKLARRVKASAILQICSYVEQLAAIQGRAPEWLHVALGGSARATEHLRVAEYMAYYRQVKAEFEAAAALDDVVYPVTATYPEPVEHCDVCRWAAHCATQRRRDDDLSLVAGISARQRSALKARGVATRRGLAGLALPMAPRLERVTAEALERVHEQARIQVEGEDAGEPRWELLQPERDGEGQLVPGRGLLALPEPSDGDLFFDIEGDPFALDDGVEYLFGVLEIGRPDRDDPTQRLYHELWSRDAAGDVTRAAERSAFERLVDLVMDRWTADPTLHVFHYAAYERSALTRLAQRHATREAEVDRLLREGVLVDLFRVVRQSVRASVESYSIKKLEPLYGFERAIELRSAGTSIVAFEAWLAGQSTEHGAVGETILQEIAAYNRDDVVSTWHLRNWLEARRWDLEAMIDERPGRPGQGVPGAEQKPVTDRDLAVAELAAVLTAGLPADPGAGTPTEHATWLLAQLLGWHRREDKAFWWRYYELLDLSDEQLVEAREPIGGLTWLGTIPEPEGAGRLLRFGFPAQDYAVRTGEAMTDPRTRAATGTIQAIDEAAQVVTLRRTRKHLDAPLPTAIVPYDFVSTDPLQDSLMRIGRWVLQHGIAAEGPRLAAARHLLLRQPPAVGQAAGAPLRDPGEDATDAAIRLALALADGTLAIQGPPGSGKTYAGAQMVVALVRAGRRVGVTANSHKVISHFLDEIERAAAGDPLVRLGQRGSDDPEAQCKAAIQLKDNGAARRALDDGTVTVLGGTAWAWSSDALDGAVDTLLVDEAGQLSLASTIALSAATRALVLLGDPQQLDQPLKGSHPPGAERSALGHLLADRPTLPPDEGLFLDRTWRLHPDVCRYTSEVFYASQLEPVDGLERQALAGVGAADGTGVRWRPVAHAGNATDSIEEATVIVELVSDLLSSGARWTDRHGSSQALALEHLLVVAPYNAHVDLIKGRLAAAGFPGARVGTVDKFQGQEAVVSIYAMASSSAEEAPRGLAFLYSLNRLNVATSRARCAAIVVASPELVRVQCHSPREIRLANALCRLVEVSAEQHDQPDDPDTTSRRLVAAG
ncbi:MAG TPA: TM0106 family RecB-like putative nuclease [Candidatus Limnocylindrales bacterium]